MSLEREWQYPAYMRMSDVSVHSAPPSRRSALEKHLEERSSHPRRRTASEADTGSTSSSRSLMNRLQNSFSSMLSFDGDDDDEIDLKSNPRLRSPLTKTAELFQQSLNILSLDDDDDDDDEEKEQFRFQESMSQLCYSQNDIQKIVNNDETFRHMKLLLRDRGVVTNSFLRQKIHLYVNHVREKERACKA